MMDTGDLVGALEAFNFNQTCTTSNLACCDESIQDENYEYGTIMNLVDTIYKPISSQRFERAPIFKHVHPSNYTEWGTNPTMFDGHDISHVVAFTPYFSTQHVENTKHESWIEVLVREINSHSNYPDLKSFPMERWTGMYRNTHLPLAMLCMGVDDHTKLAHILLDIARIYNIDPNVVPFSPIAWTWALIKCKKVSDDVDISVYDHKYWFSCALSTFAHSQVLNDENMSVCWLADLLAKTSNISIEHYPRLVALVQSLITDEFNVPAEVSEDYIEFFKWLFEEGWIEDDGRVYLHVIGLISDFYSISEEQAIQSITIKNPPPSPVRVVVSHENETVEHCPAWMHTQYSVYWVASQCQCMYKDACLLKAFTLRTLKYCQCTKHDFCILRAIRLEEHRLKGRLIKHSNLHPHYLV
jgi:hypothetical protein